MEIHLWFQAESETENSEMTFFWKFWVKKNPTRLKSVNFEFERFCIRFRPNDVWQNCRQVRAQFILFFPWHLLMSGSEIIMILILCEGCEIYIPCWVALFPNPLSACRYLQDTCFFPWTSCKESGAGRTLACPPTTTKARDGVSNGPAEHRLCFLFVFKDFYEWLWKCLR